MKGLPLDKKDNGLRNIGVDSEEATCVIVFLEDSGGPVVIVIPMLAKAVFGESGVGEESWSMSPVLGDPHPVVKL